VTACAAKKLNKQKPKKLQPQPSLDAITNVRITEGKRGPGKKRIESGFGKPDRGLQFSAAAFIQLHARIFSSEEIK
jgi:hypothetical protein